MSKDLKAQWGEFRQLFIAAHDNPIARRRETTEYERECREAFHRLDEVMTHLLTEKTVPLPAVFQGTGGMVALETLGALASLVVPNRDWEQEAKATGHLVDARDLPADAIAFSGLDDTISFDDKG